MARLCRFSLLSLELMSDLAPESVSDAVPRLFGVGFTSDMTGGAGRQKASLAAAEPVTEDAMLANLT
jgi:hypothetical protein